MWRNIEEEAGAVAEAATRWKGDTEGDRDSGKGLADRLEREENRRAVKPTKAHIHLQLQVGPRERLKASINHSAVIPGSLETIQMQLVFQWGHRPCTSAENVQKALYTMGKYKRLHNYIYSTPTKIFLFMSLFFQAC